MPKSRLTRGLRDQIAVELRKDIVAGRFAPGMQMVERQLAQRFGVSHAPIREALLQLSHEGLLVSQTNRGAQVAPVLDPALRQFFMSLRMALECHALAIAFDDLSETDFGAWDQILAELQSARQAHDAAGIAELDFALHQSIVCAAGQSDVESAWRTIVARARVYAGEWLNSAKHRPGHQDDHAYMVEHCREGNLAAALDDLQRNIRAEMQSIHASRPAACELAGDHHRNVPIDGFAGPSRAGDE